MTRPDLNEPAAERLHALLGCVEQVIRLDERVAMRLGEHRLPNGQAFVLHQHDLYALPASGVTSSMRTVRSGLLLSDLGAVNRLCRLS